MNCIETKKNIEALLDGELGELEKDAVEHHLWTCPPCLELMEQLSSLSNLLRTSAVATAPSAQLDRRVLHTFKKHHASKTTRWRRIIFGGFVIPKPVFAMLFLMVLAGLWAAFQFGKIAATTIAMSLPAVDIPVQTPPETIVQTVFVEVPVIREKTVTRTVFVREQRNDKAGKLKLPAKAGLRQNNLPSYSSTVGDNGYFTDVSLKGFEPSAEISAKIIKEVKENEK